MTLHVHAIRKCSSKQLSPHTLPEVQLGLIHVANVPEYYVSASCLLYVASGCLHSLHALCGKGSLFPGHLPHQGEDVTTLLALKFGLLALKVWQLQFVNAFHACS